MRSAAAAQEAPDRTTSERFVQELDTLFNAGARQEFLGRFAQAHHPELHMGLSRWLGGLSHFQGLTAKSRVLDWFRRGPVSVDPRLGPSRSW